MKKQKQSSWIQLSIVGAVMGAASLSVALGGVPRRGQVTDDTAIYQNLSELKIRKQGDLNFDQDIAQLSAIEGRYAELLPALERDERLKRPAARISAKPYSYRGSKKARTARKSLRTGSNEN